MKLETGLSLLLSFAIARASKPDCKAIPGEDSWPAQREWEALNQTLSGRLIQGVPPGAVCYPSRAEYNQEACSALVQVWTKSFYHASNPVSIDYPVWAGDSCNPIFPNGTSVTGDSDAGARGCSQGNYPMYAVNVSEPKDVIETLRFAKKHNVRLNIKNTGHSFPGRSIAFGSLSIWTHNLKGIEFQEEFKPTSCPLKESSKQWAVKIGAGEQVRSVYEQLSKHKAIAVGGSNPTVGMAGWFQGGGHGPLSTTYGMGADNLLEAEVVTPLGDIAIVNECQNSDLFYAIRGGGGGTYGVVISATMKAFPEPQTTQYTLEMALLDGSKTTEWYNLMGYIHSEFARLKEGGLQGYYGIFGPPTTPIMTFWSSFFLYDKPNGTMEALLGPIKAKVATSGFAVYQESTKSGPSFFEVWNATVGIEDVANGGGAMGSRLLSKASLTNADQVARTLEKIGPKLTLPAPPLTESILIGHFIANEENRNLSIGLNPAWRDAISHLVIIDNWHDGIPRNDIQRVYDDITFNRTQALRELDPHSGAYFNEADPYEPNFQWAFWGPNYSKLRSIKKKYDPAGLLWCRSCVGSEGWNENTEHHLCRT